MIKSDRYLNASSPTRPYEYNFNTKGYYNSVVETCTKLEEMTDEQIEYLANAEADHFAVADNTIDLQSDLYGDEYADAVMSELGLM